MPWGFLHLVEGYGDLMPIPYKSPQTMVERMYMTKHELEIELHDLTMAWLSACQAHAHDDSKRIKLLIRDTCIQIDEVDQGIMPPR